MATVSTTPVRTAPWPAWPQFGAEEGDALSAVLQSGVWSDANGAEMEALQREYAAFASAEHAVAVSTGTVAIVLVLRALGIGAGDEVIVPAYTFLATATAVLEVNALPVFADISAETWCLDPAAVEAAITPRTRAIIPVHLGGHPADMDALRAIADKHGLALIEDSAHAHGSQWNGQPVGALGTAGTWSFQQSKNLTAGEGGMVTTNDPHLADAVESGRNCGRAKGGVWYEHHVMSGNFRLTEWQSAVLRHQLRRYPAQLARRNASGLWLDGHLSELPGISPLKRDPRTTMHSYHLYCFTYDPDAFGGLTKLEFVHRMQQEGIPLSAGYPIPLYRQPLFAERNFDERAVGYNASYAATDFRNLNLPHTELACSDGVWIPQHVLLADETDLADILEAFEKVRKAG